LGLSLGTTDIGASVGSPDLANREQAMVAVSSVVVTAWAAIVRTLQHQSLIETTNSPMEQSPS